MRSLCCALIYGPTGSREKADFWSALQNLNHDENIPWVCLGDFNDILNQAEKFGGRAISSASSRGLSHFLQTMGFVNLGSWAQNSRGVTIIRGSPTFMRDWIVAYRIYLSVFLSQMLLPVTIPLLL